MVNLVIQVTYNRKSQITSKWFQSKLEINTKLHSSEIPIAQQNGHKIVIKIHQCQLKVTQTLNKRPMRL